MESWKIRIVGLFLISIGATLAFIGLVYLWFDPLSSRGERALYIVAIGIALLTIGSAIFWSVTNEIEVKENGEKPS